MNAGPVYDRKFLIFAALLLAVTFIVFIPSLSLEFVDWDDPGTILENPHLVPFADQWSWDAIKNMFLSDASGNYNPLTIVSFAIEKYFFAPDPASAPFIFHFDNLWMHLVCTLCVYILFIKLGAGKAASFVGALFFGIHPMRVESVAWVTERKDVLYGMFYLLALVCYVNYARSAQKKTAWYLLAIALSIFSYFSKIQSVTLPLCMVAVDYYLGRNWKSLRILILEKLPWWLLSLMIGLANIYFLSKTKAISSLDIPSHYNFIQKLAIGAYSYLIYLVKLIFPYKTLVYYDYPAQLPLLAYVALILVPVGIILLIVWALRKKYSYLVFGILFFTFNVIFMLQVFSVGAAYQADRFTYIAYLGLFFIIAKLYRSVNDNFRSYTKGLNIGLIAILLLFSFMTFSKTKVWQNSLTLWTNYTEVEPDSYFGYDQLGIYYVKQASLEDVAMYNTNISMGLQNFEIADQKDSINQRPSVIATAQIFENLGIAYGILGKHDKAVYYFTREIQLVPKSKDAYSNRAYEYFRNKEHEQAIADYSKYLQIDYSADGIYYSRANCYYAIKKYDSSLLDLNRAISINPRELPQYYIARAMVFQALSDTIAARKDANTARSIGGDVPPQLLN